MPVHMNRERRRLIRLVQSRPLLWKYNVVYNSDYIKAANKLWTIISKRLGMNVMVAKAKWKGIRSNFRKEIKNATMLFTRPFNRDTYVSRNPDFKLLSFLVDDILAKERWKKKNMLTKKTIKAVKSPKNPRKIKVEEHLVETEEVTEMREDSEHFEVLPLENNSNQCNIPMPSISTPTTEIQQPLHQLIRVKPEFVSEADARDYSPIESFNSISNSTPLVGFNIVDRAEDDDYLFLMSCLPKLNSLNLARNMYVRYKIQELFYKEFNPELTLS